MNRVLAAILMTVSLLGTGCSTDLEPGASGEQIYAALCLRCHGADLSGGVGPALGAGSNLADQPDAYLTQSITLGLGRMPSFRNTLTEDQIRRVAEYVRDEQAAG
jgi:mono/diheme cytochrome c family protein